MKIAIMGTGGVGGYFGGRLAAAGEDVTFIARGAHLQAIRDNGLLVRSELGDAQVRPAKATDDPREIGPVEIVFFAPKLYDTESAGELCRPLVGEDTAVISMLNGIDSEERLIPILGREHVAGGVAYISAAIQSPGVIQHNGKGASIAFGELDGSMSPRLKRFHQAAEKAGIDAKFSDNIWRDIWAKFVMLAPFAAVTSLTRLPAGPIRQDPDTRQLFSDAVAEAAAVAKAKGNDLGPDIVKRIMDTIDRMGPTFRSSMLTDLERGNRLELEWLSGAICRLGRELGVETPVNRVAYAALKPYAEGRR